MVADQDVTEAGAPAACRVDTTFSIMKVAPSSCSSHRLVRGRARGWGRQWHLVGGEGPKGGGGGIHLLSESLFTCGPVNWGNHRAGGERLIQTQTRLSVG